MKRLKGSDPPLRRPRIGECRLVFRTVDQEFIEIVRAQNRRRFIDKVINGTSPVPRASPQFRSGFLIRAIVSSAVPAKP